MQRGDRIVVRALKADGQVYRWWCTEVAAVSADCIVTITPVGETVHDVKGDWEGRQYVRTYFWTDRPYNLNELYTRDMAPACLYVHIGSPARLTADGLEFVDNELDVLQNVGDPIKLVDEDDFAEAIARYGYTPEFQAACRQAAAEAMALVAGWEWPGRAIAAPAD